MTIVSPVAFVRRRMILVTGMHRSGTSALTRALNLYGISLPSDLVGANHANVDGFWEPSPVVLLHDDLLASLGFTWDDIREFPTDWFDTAAAVQYRDRLWNAIQADLTARGQLLVKDPRLCRLAPLWLRMGREQDVDLSFVIPLRNPIDVAASLAHRNKMPRGKALLLWLRHFLEAERATRGARRCFIAYEHLMQDWKSTIHTIVSTLDLPLPERYSDVAEQIEDFLKMSRWHHRRTHDELMPSWVRGAYEWGLSATRGNDTDFKTLDAIHEGLHAAEEMYRPLIDLCDSELGHQLAERNAAVRLLEEARAAWEDERQNLCDERCELLAAQEVMSEALVQAEQAREISKSTCWRLTSPLRSLGKLVLRRS